MLIKMKRFSSILAAVLLAVSAVSCGKDTDSDPDPDDNPVKEPVSLSGDVQGVWESGSVIEVTGHINVPEGQTLTVEEGVEVIFSEKGAGANHAPIEFTVNGNLYVRGSAEKPVLFSVAEELRTDSNIFNEDAMWGGIVATESCEELLIDHAIIEYTGGQVIEGSPAATNGIYTAGDDAYPQITLTRMDGRYVITDNVIRNGWSDGIYVIGGNVIISGNTFAANGYDGAEAVNAKAGSVVDVAGNVMFSPNTNGLKLSSSGQSVERHQAKITAYNNTVINAGWRRDGEKGGSIYVEKNALVTVVNNLMVNCKFRAMTPKYTSPDDPEKGYDDDSVIDYNYYASGSQKSSIVFDEESGVAFAWQGYNYDHSSYSPEVDLHSTLAVEADGKDPLFVNFDINSVSLTEYVYDASWDFHLKEGSPALVSTAASVEPYFAVNGLTVGSETYLSPALKPYCGAFGK